jgi:hypothetical protein
MSTLEQRDLFHSSDTSCPATRLPEPTRRAVRAELRQLIAEAITGPTKQDDEREADHHDG